MSTKFSIKKRLKSFKYAFNGLKTLLLEEHNARIHLFATIVVLIIAYWLNINTTEWIAILFAIGLVFAAELFNSSIERLADSISKEENLYIKKSKDMAAAAVLVMAIIALLTGGIIFIPKIIGWF